MLVFILGGGNGERKAAPGQDTSLDCTYARSSSGTRPRGRHFGPLFLWILLKLLQRLFASKFEHGYSPVGYPKGLVHPVSLDCLKHSLMEKRAIGQLADEQ